MNISHPQRQVPGNEILFRATENAFERQIKARRKMIRALNVAANECDEVAKVQKGLEVSGGVIAALGLLLYFNKCCFY